MFNRKWTYGILIALLVIILILGGIIYFYKNSSDLEIIFLDVGQGDAILVKQGANQMLIDGGRSGKLLLEKLGQHIPFWDRNMEIIIATHPDQDHIGGLVSVLESYKVSKVIKTDATSESQTYKALASGIEKEEGEIVEARKGLKIKFPNGAEAEIIYPFSEIDNSAGSNDNSVVMKLNFGENNFLFTSDLPSEREFALINNADTRADVLKVAHHGSKYSTSEEFLNAVNPEEVIVSVGKNNSYGHPAPEVLERILKRGIKIFRTDEMGDILCKCKDQSLKCKLVFE